MVFAGLIEIDVYKLKGSNVNYIPHNSSVKYIFIFSFNSLIS